LTITAGVIRTELVDEKWDGKTYYLKAKLAADPDEIAHSIRRLLTDRDKTVALEDTQRENERLVQELNQLKNELRLAKTEVQKKYDQTAQELMANQWATEGATLLLQNDQKGALAALNKAIDLNPRESKYHLVRATVFSTLGSYPQAIEDYNRAIELNPGNAVSYNNRGVVYFRMEDNKKALRDYTKAIELTPAAPAIYYNNRAGAYAALGDYEHAIRDYIRAAEENPELLRANFEKGFRIVTFDKRDSSGISRWASEEDTARKIKLYDEGIRRNPKHPKLYLAYVSRGNSYGERGDYDSAIQDYSKALALNPKLSIAYFNRAYTYAHLKKYREAITDLDETIKLNPKDEKAYFWRGICNVSVRNYPKALDDFSRIIELDPADTRYYALAYTYREMVNATLGAYDRAIYDSKKAIELGKENAAAYNNLGLGYYGLGNYEEALRNYDKAIELNPKLFVAYQNRAMVYRKLGNTKQADVDLQTAKRLQQAGTKDDPSGPSPRKADPLTFLALPNSYGVEQFWRELETETPQEALTVDGKPIQSFAPWSKR
jgi:tetratricopeptide (TPR) repeat protein